MKGEFEHPDARLHWLWPAIIVGMATLFVVLLVTTGLVWWLREPEVSDVWSPADDVGQTMPASQPTRLAPDARGPGAREGEAPAEPAVADIGTARQAPRPPETGEAKPAAATPVRGDGNRGSEPAPGTASPKPPNLFVWSLAKDQATGAYGEGDCPNVMALSRDGQRIATGDSRGVVRVLETSTGKVLHQLRAHTDAVTDLDFSPGGQLVATAALNEICVFDLTSYEPVQTFRVDTVRTVAFSPDGRRLASGGFREEVFLWDVRTGRRFDTLKAESAFSDRHITRIAFLPDPHGLVTGATGGKIRLWRLPD